MIKQLPEIEMPSAPAPAPERFAVVLAGGTGTRLWPVSRASMPKQLLTLNGTESLMQQTVRRLAARVDGSHIITVTHADHRFEVAGQLHAVNPQLVSGVLAEPMSRNTLPAISWAVARIALQSPQALIGVFSSDHAIADDSAFQQAWATAEAAASEGYLALFGMRPTEPATGFGYIQAGETIQLANAHCAGEPPKSVIRFEEKPDLTTARSYLERGGYYWNGGIFVFRADVFLALLERFQPAIRACLPTLQAGESNIAPTEVYRSLPDLSIDYGLVEFADKVAVVPVEMGWSDLGSWDAVYGLRAKDEARNMVQGRVVAVDCQDNLLWSDHGLLATFGLENIAVVQTRDATLVCPREKAADLKRLVSKVREQDRSVTETHLTVARPWGSYTILEEGPRYKIKRIVVNPGAKLSMQMHFHRAEHWVVISGTARIVNGDEELFLKEDESTYIPRTRRHRVENPGKIPLQIMEIQTGPYLEEDDIVRFGDIYGRS